MSLYLVSGIFATCWDRIRSITTRRARAYHWTRMRQFRGYNRGSRQHHCQAAPRRIAPSVRPDLISGRDRDAELHRLAGTVLLAENKLDEDEASLQQAIRIAQAQQAKSLELRAVRDLARLWGEQGRRTEARDLVAPVYSWFTEGFDTADLKEAKALLDQLA